MEQKQISVRIPMWDIEAETGYKPLTTFWQDFSFADAFGAESVKDTYKRAFNEWKSDYKYLTELVLVLNHKIWQHYGGDNELAKVYNDLWDKAAAYAERHLKGNELQYYYQTTD